MKELKQIELDWVDIESAIEEHLAECGYSTTGVLRCFAGSQPVTVSSMRVEVEKSALLAETTD